MVPGGMVPWCLPLTGASRNPQHPHPGLLVFIGQGGCQMHGPQKASTHSLSEVTCPSLSVSSVWYHCELGHSPEPPPP